MPTEGSDWTEAVAEASHHVAERGAAAEQASQKQRPKDQAPKMAALAVLQLLSLVWVGYRYQAPLTEAPIDETVNLAWFVVDAVEVVEDFREEYGRLPEGEESSTLFDEGLVVTARGEAFTVSIDDGTRSIEYTSETPLDEWVGIYAGRQIEEEG